MGALEAAGAGGGPGGDGPGRAGPDPAGPLGYRPPTESLDGWASSMERLIPGRTKRVAVVVVEQQQNSKLLQHEYSQLHLL